MVNSEGSGARQPGCRSAINLPCDLGHRIGGGREDVPLEDKLEKSLGEQVFLFGDREEFPKNSLAPRPWLKTQKHETHP